ncbi:uncharacterized protein LOC111636295 [Centruroides sculpturatus]|uniref:uncharacterized protein LOC111636286 n=1 Tax=Centruroides sculpturatus TaxID=218467 RepID=UPI000C6CC5DF|nr:uncharacterized protein LOC111636286 [Centruroides sculpturatus]XP_023237279.1 uncharacterized protein LOC111636295 [Centruroides sculpturatus]
MAEANFSRVRSNSLSVLSDSFKWSGNSNSDDNFTRLTPTVRHLDTPTIDTSSEEIYVELIPIRRRQSVRDENDIEVPIFQSSQCVDSGIYRGIPSVDTVDDGSISRVEKCLNFVNTIDSNRKKFTVIGFIVALAIFITLAYLFSPKRDPRILKSYTMTAVFAATVILTSVVIIACGVYCLSYIGEKICKYLRNRNTAEQVNEEP